MSLLPYLLDDSYLLRPSKLMDQHFGLALDPADLLQPLTVPSLLIRCPAGYFRNWKSAASERDTGSAVTYDKDRFQANLDVQQFKPEEITVKVTGDNTITIEGKHEERPDEHGQIYRHFVRKYVVPKNYDMARVESKLSSDGVLTISAPKVDDKQIEHKTIPISQTGEPAKPVEQKSSGDKK
nr:heat shock protein 20 [Monochamus alternatus]